MENPADSADFGSTARWKILLTLPTLGALLVLFSFTERPTRLTEPTTLEISASSANKTSGVASDDNQKEKTTTETQSLPELDKKSKTPLIILDGKKITNKEFEELPSNNIDNMSILKDQAAEGLYGKKGKNGVVVITSKRDIDTKTNETMASVKVIGYGSMPKGESTPATNKEPQTAQTAKKEVPFIMAEVMPKFEGAISILSEHG